MAHSEGSNNSKICPADPPPPYALPTDGQQHPNEPQRQGDHHLHDLGFEHEGFGLDQRTKYMTVSRTEDEQTLASFKREFIVPIDSLKGLPSEAIPLFIGQLPYEYAYKLNAIATMAWKLRCFVFIRNRASQSPPCIDQGEDAKTVAFMKIWVPNRNVADQWVYNTKRLVLCDRPGGFFVAMNSEGEKQISEYATAGGMGRTHLASIPGVPLGPVNVEHYNPTSSGRNSRPF